MDADIWCNLPQDLVEKILARLPAFAILQMRGVCKRWKSLIQSSYFSYLRRLNAPNKPYFLFHLTVGRTEHLVTFDPVLEKWCRIPLPYMPPGLDASLVASAGGLLCFRVRKMGIVSYLICNPVTKCCRELPPPLHYRSTYRSPCMQALVVDPNKNTYKLVVAGYSTGRDPTTEVYSSINNSWKLVGNLPLKGDSKATLFQPYSGKPFCNGNLYCRAFLPPSVIVYSVEEEVWVQLKAPINSSVLTPYLVEHHGHVLMVGGLRKAGRKEFSPDSFCIWELDHKEMQWKEVARMPEDMRKLFLQRNVFSKFRSIGKGDLIYFTSASAASSVVMYDFSLNLWKLLPECKLKVGRHHLASLVGHQLVWDRVFIFEPSLDAAI
ncbi:hypothetical protein O6H91_01G104500 [Diphasiastrum complanatum]|uniref:Uncharacterized protein n=1 Tax=Diphasiastrum complanatum TaxID=34168 RepID=A0ACC2EU58_DIPCM|nr:hypothetical protein O6H91_01G104500 [Diphasiastrum complanatum]